MGSDKSNPNDLNIWGEPEPSAPEASTEEHEILLAECFHCCEYYDQTTSTAASEYAGTYCSVECQQKSELRMKMAAEAEARFSQPPAVPTTEDLKPGAFRLKPKVN